MRPAPSRSRPRKSFGGLHAVDGVIHARARRAPPDPRPERRRQDHALQPDHRRPAADLRHDQALRHASSPTCPPARRMCGLARTYQIITPVPARHAAAQRGARACSGLGARALEPLAVAARRSAGPRRGARGPDPGDGGARPIADRRGGASPPTARSAASRSRMALAQRPRRAAARRAARRPVAAERADVQRLLAAIPPRRPRPLIEHDMDVALDSRRARHPAALRRGDRRRRARRGDRRPATREVYLGD